MLATKYKVLKQVLLYVLICIPIVIHISYINRYSVNLPKQDDYDAILDFLNIFKKAPFADRVPLLFQQHNEHRILSSNIVYSLYFLITGKINFQHLIFIDVTILILIFAITTYFIKRSLPKDWTFAALVLSLCLFDLNNVENSNFAMAGMQNYGVVFLYLSAVLFYSFKNRINIVPAVFFQIICIFSSGNGIIASFFITLFVLFQKDNLKIIIAILVFFTITPLYYYHYVRSGSFSLPGIEKIIPFFLHIIGAHFSYSFGIFAGILLLFVSFLFIILCARKRLIINHKLFPWLSIIGFLLASMFVVAVFRSHLPIEWSFAGRYYIYSHLFVAVTFVFLLVYLENSKALPYIAIISIVLLLPFYKWNCNDGKICFKTSFSTITNTAFDYPDTVRARQITDESCRLGIYCIDKARSEIK